MALWWTNGSLSVSSGDRKWELYDRVVTHAEIRMVNGEAVRVEGTLNEVEKELSDAARSGSSRIAWLTQEGTDQQIGVNPDHVVSLRLVGGER